jgi:phosphopantetheinyl transferase
MLAGKPSFIESKRPLSVNISLSDELWAVAKTYTQIQVVC